MFISNSNEFDSVYRNILKQWNTDDTSLCRTLVVLPNFFSSSNPNYKLPFSSAMSESSSCGIGMPCFFQYRMRPLNPGSSPLPASSAVTENKLMLEYIHAISSKFKLHYPVNTA